MRVLINGVSSLVLWVKRLFDYC